MNHQHNTPLQIDRYCGAASRRLSIVFLRLVPPASTASRGFRRPNRHHTTRRRLIVHTIHKRYPAYTVDLQAAVPTPWVSGIIEAPAFSPKAPVRG
ncbi:hypothetical protein FHL15_006566 [Xylaria flabelliformis]|uniref:Uncharacterized protein n=1 Tax=Xylaria flabelliformis TaxID=2512241 RepID=A0A553HXF8_9PEZI|nr:hypothetical protein FHL15_006566 [Xylaria flabelliformis]